MPAPAATANRPLAKPSKVRYFKNKPLADVRSDSDESDEDVAPVQAPAPVKPDPNLVAGGAGRVVTSVQRDAKPQMKVQLRDVKVEGGRVLVGGEVPRPSKPDGAVEEESEEEETDEEEEDEDDAKPRVPGEESSEYETDSEEEESEEEVKKPAFRPVFVRKDQRGMTQEKAAAAAEAALREEEEMREQRKLDSKDLAGETIRRELAEKLKSPEEALDLQPDVDDTDGLDPATEFEEWRARELARLLRDKEAQAAKDAEREEIERRRALPEEQRLREDMEHAEATRAKEKGDMGFMQKYYHKGAFHLDEDLANRDYTLATESAVDMSMLPKVLQVRDYGKMSRSKYTHLADQDTSQGGWGAASRQGSSAFGQQGQTQQGCWNCGGPHLRKDCPNNDINTPPGGMGGVGNPGAGTSANSAALGYGGASSRGWGDRDEPREDGRSRYREEGRERRFAEERESFGRERGYERDDRDNRDYSRRREANRNDYDRNSHRRDARHRSRSRSPRRDKDRRDDRDRERDRDRRR